MDTDKTNHHDAPAAAEDGRGRREQRARLLAAGLRLAGGGLLIAVAAIHLDLYVTGYQSIPTIGGLFLFKSSAVDFAISQSAPARCALVFPVETFELDIENRGNPLIGLAEHAGQVLARFAARSRK